MSSVLNVKSASTPFICGLRYLPSDRATVSFTSQSFNDTVLLEGATQDIYASLSSISFTQSSKNTPAGQSFLQEVSFQFPNGDNLAAQRLDEILLTRALVIKLTDGSEMVLGRNDFFQNTRPVISTKNTTRTTQVIFKCESIFPVGRYNDISGELLPQFIPIM